jgi:hypothetical protein
MNPEEILVFQYSVDEEDVQQFVKDLFWWVQFYPAAFCQATIIVVNIE